MNLKRLLALLLCVSLLIALISCAKEEASVTETVTEDEVWTETEEQTTEATTTTTKAPTTTTVPPVTLTPTVNYGKGESYTAVLKNNLTIEQVNSLPVANYTMSAAQLRDICWDFMAFQMNIWLEGRLQLCFQRGR